MPVMLNAVNLRHGTDGFTSPPKEVVLRIFITLKNMLKLKRFHLTELLFLYNSQKFYRLIGLRVSVRPLDNLLGVTIILLAYT
jgi:hypothetical protein